MKIYRRFSLAILVAGTGAAAIILRQMEVISETAMWGVFIVIGAISAGYQARWQIPKE
jgi:hypothetical protein